jgi:hypothetical protein
MVNVSGSRSAVADAQRDMPRETQLDEERMGMEDDVRIEAKHDYSPIEAEAIEDRLYEYNRGAAGAHDDRTLGHSASHVDRWNRVQLVDEGDYCLARALPSSC